MYTSIPTDNMNLMVDYLSFVLPIGELWSWKHLLNQSECAVEATGQNKSKTW